MAVKTYRLDWFGVYFRLFTQVWFLVLLFFATALLFAKPPNAGSGYWALAFCSIGLVVFVIVMVALNVLSAQMELDGTSLSLRTRFGLDQKSFLLRHIEEVEKRQSVLDWLLGIGYIALSTGENEWIVFGPIRNPDQAIRDIKEAIRRSTTP